MTLEQLRIFIAVAEREHVTQAARALNLTQSATSAAIAALEARYDTKLFDRVGRGIVLTEAGRAFLGEARAVLARAGAAETVLAELAGLKRGTLKIAASQTVGNYWMPARLAAYRARYPGIALTATVTNTQTVAEMVRDGLADIGLVEGEVDDPLLAVRPVATDRLVLVVSPAHPWAGRAAVSVADFAHTAWVVREPGSGTRAALEGALEKAGLSVADIEIAVELPTNEAVRAAVEAGAGAAILSSHVTGGAILAGALASPRVTLPVRRFSLIRHKEHHRTNAASAFEALLAETASDVDPASFAK
ncbi:LysR family transcriptional regulator [Mesorhizobium xinjiangense]|uniref:LysR family transcriptional regulator n=1 Tax=Mesorhizobium xinjiangense TaxID=2678685 RepID=UPI0012EE7798|nr:LysR family transcriptional regulator [Mesorhizobium xinjiangense]